MAVVAAIITVATLAPVVIVAVGIADRATGATAHSCANQAARAAADALANHVAAGCAKAAADGRFGTATLVRTHHAARRTTDARADGGAGRTTQVFADHRPERTAQGAANSGFGVASGKGGAAEQARGQQQNRGILHGGTSPVDGAAILTSPGRGPQASTDERCDALRFS